MKRRKLPKKSARQLLKDEIGRLHRENKLTIICKNCGKSFKRWPSQTPKLASFGIFCSQNCLSLFRKQRVKKECLSCGKVFDVITYRENRAKFCSFKCYSQYYKGRKRKPFTEEHRRNISASRIGLVMSKETRNKISRFMKKRKLSISHKIKLSLSKLKELNPAWRGGVSNYPYPLDFNESLKNMIRRRDNFKCCNCGAPQEEFYSKLSVHHIDFDKNNINTENLITLCKTCHAKTNWGLRVEKNIFEGKNNITN
jgi:hypothetical protein